MPNYLLTNLVIFLSPAIDYKFSWMEILFCSFLFPQYQVVCQESINNFINISWWITNTLPKVSIQEVCQCQQFPSRLVKNLFHLPSVQFSHSVVSDLATPWTAARQASLSITNSWNLLKLMSIKSVIPSSHLILCRPLLLLSSIFPSIRVFSMSQFFTSGGQSIGASAFIIVLPMNIQDWFPLGLTGLISLLSKGLLTVFSNTIVQKHYFFGAQLSLRSNSHIQTRLLEKPLLWPDLCR